MENYIPEGTLHEAFQTSWFTTEAGGDELALRQWISDELALSG